MEKDAEAGEEKVGEIRSEVAGRLDLDRQREIAPPDARKKFFAGLDRAFRPAMLLRFEAVHVDRQFRRRHDIGQEDKLPALELRAVAEVEVFGERVVLPATGFSDARFAPESGRAVEIKEASAAAARDLLEEEVAVEKHRLHPGEQGVAAIDVAPAGLDHPDFRVGEKVNGRLEQLGLRDKVGVEDADEIAARGVEAVLERPGLKADAIGRDGAARHRSRAPASAATQEAVSSRVSSVESSSTWICEQVARIIEFADRLEQALDDVDFVEERELHGDHRELARNGPAAAAPLPVFQEEIDDEIAVQSVTGEADEDTQVTERPDYIHNASSHSRLLDGAAG